MFKSNSSCAAFLSNYNDSSAARVSFWGSTYDLPPWSVSILPDCKTEYYNTAKVESTYKAYLVEISESDLCLTSYRSVHQAYI